MEKLIYKNDEQLINDAVKMLIENHLAWSGSDKEMPSRDLGNVKENFMNAYWDDKFTADEWRAMTQDEHKEYFKLWASQFDKAAAEADRKWEAVKVMLDL